MNQRGGGGGGGGSDRSTAGSHASMQQAPAAAPYTVLDPFPAGAVGQITTGSRLGLGIGEIRELYFVRIRRKNMVSF
jgi:hypothetical protein